MLTNESWNLFRLAGCGWTLAFTQADQPGPDREDCRLCPVGDAKF